MNTLTRKEIRRLVGLLGGAAVVREMLPNFHRGAGWQDAKYPEITFGQEEALLNIIGQQNVLDLLSGKKTLELEDAASDATGAVQFSVAGMFKPDKSDNASVKITHVGDHFKSWFKGKTKAHVFTIPRFHHDLQKDSLDAEILNDLGGEATAEVTLDGIWELMKLQGACQDGALLTDGSANIFYARDEGGILRAVDVGWRAFGWGVGAESIDALGGWHAGSRVFSH